MEDRIDQVSMWVNLIFWKVTGKCHSQKGHRGFGHLATLSSLYSYVVKPFGLWSVCAFSPQWLIIWVVSCLVDCLASWALTLPLWEVTKTAVTCLGRCWIHRSWFWFIYFSLDDTSIHFLWFPVSKWKVQGRMTDTLSHVRSCGFLATGSSCWGTSHDAVKFLFSFFSPLPMH